MIIQLAHSSLSLASLSKKVFRSFEACFTRSFWHGLCLLGEVSDNVEKLLGTRLKFIKNKNLKLRMQILKSSFQFHHGLEMELIMGPKSFFRDF